MGGPGLQVSAASMSVSGLGLGQSVLPGRARDTPTLVIPAIPRDPPLESLAPPTRSSPTAVGTEGGWPGGAGPKGGGRVSSFTLTRRVFLRTAAPATGNGAHQPAGDQTTPGVPSSGLTGFGRPENCVASGCLCLHCCLGLNSLLVNGTTTLQRASAGCQSPLCSHTLTQKLHFWDPL